MGAKNVTLVPARARVAGLIIKGKGDTDLCGNKPEPEWRIFYRFEPCTRSDSIDAIDLFSLQRSGIIGDGAGMLPVGPTGRQVEPTTILRSEGSLQPAEVCNSVTNDPTGLVTVRTAIEPTDSPRRYIKYAATAPATIVPQNNALFIMAPLRAHT